MTPVNLPPRPVAAGTTESSSNVGSYVDWAAILAGGIFALAISFMLIGFGSSLGLSLASPFEGEGMSTPWLAIAAGIWLVWVMVTGFGAGGYLAGRMRHQAGDATAEEVAVRDGAHGLMVWATGALVGIVLAASGVGGFISASTSAAGTVASATAETVSSDYFANVMLRGTISEPETEATADPATDEATTTPDGTEPAPTPRPQAAQSNTMLAGVDPGVQQEVASIIARSLFNGEVAERDSQYLAQLVAANSDLEADAARARVDEVNAEIDDARAEAMEVVEKARIAGVVFGFIAVATLLAGAVAAFFAAAAGGRHRDEGLGPDALVARR